MSTVLSAERYLAHVDRATALDLARHCRCTQKELLEAIGEHRDFRRIAGRGVWDWTLERSAMIRARGIRIEADLSVRGHNAVKRDEFKQEKKAQPKTAVRIREILPAGPWTRPAELVRYRSGWRGVDGSPCIVVALRALGTASIARIAYWCGLTVNAVRLQASEYSDQLTAQPGRPALWSLKKRAV